MDENQKDLSGLALSLSAAHSSALAARMLILEQDCREIEHFLDGYSGIFYQHLGVFPADTRRTIRCLISEIMGRKTGDRRDVILVSGALEHNTERRLAPQKGGRPRKPVADPRQEAFAFPKRTRQTARARLKKGKN